MDQSLFKNPSNEFRGRTFWAWNDLLDKDELRRQIRNFRDMGLGGYFCHSRVGLRTEYLGDDWFDLINLCADEGEANGMETWLYDEDRWPSGTAGGKITENPAYRLNYLRLNLARADGFVWTDEIIAAFAVSLSGLSFSAKRRLQKGEMPEAGETALFFTVEEMTRQSVYNGFTYVDAMNRDAVDSFLRKTHEQYAEKCGARLGREIKGIFTDEPHRGAVMNGFGIENPRAEFLIPYTPALFGEFESRFGYSLEDHLPELFLQKDGEKCSRVKWQYMDLLQSLFDENFMAPIRDWCRGHRMILTGHMLHENTLTHQTCMIGSVMRSYEFMDIPGIDILGEVSDYWVAVQLRSVGRQFDKPALLTELYGCTGWQMDFHSHKALGDWQALFGANIRCQHLSWYSMKGEAKRDYPASISHQSAWFREYRCIEDYFARMNMLLAEGEPVCDTLVINPVESVWSIVYPGWSNNLLETVDPDAARLEAHYEALFAALAGSQIDFDYGDEFHLQQYGSVEVRGGEPVLRLGKMAYRNVVVPMMITMRETTLRLLAEFSEKGGRLIFAAAPPAYIDAVKNPAAERLPAYSAAAADVPKYLSVPPVRVGHRDSARLFCQARKTPDGYTVVLLNTDRTASLRNVAVRFPEEGEISGWDLRTGEIVSLGCGQSLVLDFAPSQERCFKVSRTPAVFPEPAAEEASAEYQTRELQAEAFAYSLSEPNVCVLDFPAFSIGGASYPPREVLLADREIRRRTGLSLRGSEMLQPWFVGAREPVYTGEIELVFSFRMEFIPQIIYLAVETPEEFKILINGKENAFTLSGEYWVDSCFRLLALAPSALRVGENTVTLQAKMHQKLDIEAVYLLGDFAVFLKGITPVIAPLPERIEAGDISGQGFPFYGGGLTYFLENLPGGAAFIGLDGFDAALVKLKGAGGEKVLFAPPYTAALSDICENGSLELEYIFTRRNTFGPLHYKPVYAEKYGPDIFLREGPDEALHTGYSLVPQGMTGKIRIACPELSAVSHSVLSRQNF